MNKLAILWREFLTALEATWSSRAYRFFAGSLLLFSLFVQVAVPEIEYWMGFSGSTFLDIARYPIYVLLLLALSLFLIALIRALRNLKDPIPRTDLDQYECRIIDDEFGIRRVHALDAEQWSEIDWPVERMLQISQRNPATLIGVFRRGSEEVLGWSEIYPVTSKFGRDFEHGKKTDEDIALSDILLKSRNEAAKFVVVVTFALAPKVRGDTTLALRLGRFLVAHICEQFRQLCSLVSRESDGAKWPMAQT